MRPARLFVVDPQVAGDDYDALGAATGSPDEIRRAAARLQRLAHAGAFTQVTERSIIVYRLGVGDHQQTGVVVEVPVDDYRKGRVRRHEATRDDRERELSEFQVAAGIELVPVTLAHQARPRLKALLAEATAGEPDVHVISRDGLAQTVWVVRAAELKQQIQVELAGTGTLYIADGHHRLAVAERHASGQARPGGDRAVDFVLGALFPADEMRVLGYHRGVRRPERMSASQVLAALSRQPGTDSVGPCSAAAAAQSAPGEVSVYLGGQWYRLRLRTAPGAVDARAALDVVALEDGVLAPMLEAVDARLSAQIEPLPGSYDPEAVARWCTERQAIGFLLHPPSVEEVMAVSDAGLLMPPKSTWFDPKARAGPFLRDLRC